MQCSHADSVHQITRGQHACLVYDDCDDPLAAVAPYVAAGLERNERCMYVVGEFEPDRIKAGLSEAGIDVEHQIARGALLLVSRWEVSFPSGEFEPAAMIGFVRQAIDQSLADGFMGLRVVAEMTWALQMGVGANRLIHYEALGNHLYPDEPLAAICLYNRSRFPAEVCLDALRVHPWVAVGDRTYDNIYYELPDAVINGATANARIDWMLAQLRRLRAAEAQRLQLAYAEAARSEAESAADAREALLSMLAHELRTPLTSMIAYAQNALRRLDHGEPVQPAALRRVLEVVIEQSFKQDKLIDQVLDAARVAARQLPLSPTRLNLCDLILQVTELAQASSPRHRLQVDLPAHAEVVADPLRLEQVLVNLLDNARKYSPPDSVIHVHLAMTDHHAVIAVHDVGSPIPPQEHDRIFERFQRVRRDQKGVGLGLHISREIIRLHGGDLTLETPAEGGNRFVIRVPTALAPPLAPSVQVVAQVGSP